MTNFRAVKMGGIAEGVLYRSGHPAPFGDEDMDVVEAAERAGINCVINLDDSRSSLPFIVECSPWYAGLVERGTADAFKMEFDFCTPAFRKTLRSVLLFMINTDGPYLVHCYAGVDRTGIVCAILEALMGAALEDITADYARSFHNGADSAVYPGSAKDAGNEIVRQLSAVFRRETEPVTAEALQTFAEDYLTNDVHITGAQMAALKARLSGEKNGQDA